MAWQLGLAANLAIVLAYFAISFLISRGLSRTGQLRSNKLGLATAVIFFSCGVGHLLHVGHLIEMPESRQYLDWHMAIWDSVTACIAFIYVSLRRSYTQLLEGGEMFDNEHRVALERELEHQAFHDDLTGLPNRPLLMDRLSGALARGMRRDTSCAVLFVDLDRFKLVNDSLGHMRGDALLQKIAKRLAGCVRPEDTVARIGGDEFVVLVEQVGGAADAFAVADRIAAAFAPQLMEGEQELFITCSIGIAISRPGVDRPEDLLRDADIALYSAKAIGPARVELFDPGVFRRPLDRLELETDLRHAIERDQLELHFQPKIWLAGERIAGAEALLRWRHPRRGLIMPDDFVPLAEETGMIVDIGRWVLGEACRAAATWPEPLAVCVNLSAREFQRADLAVAIGSAIDASGLHPGRLCLELTESVVMNDVETALVTMGRLKELGVELALDDFGTGYSSLTYLRRFPLDVLKLDRSFISGISIDAQSEAIVAALVALGHTLGLRVVGEGVESSFQFERLRALGCDLAQGFHLWPPLEAAAFSELVGEPAAI